MTQAKTTVAERPGCYTEEMEIFLDARRELGVTNMFGAAPYLRAEFPSLGRRESQACLAYWMQEFGRES